MKQVKKFFLIGLFLSGMLIVSCSDDDLPPAENEEEVINEVTLTFSPVGGGADVVGTYVDPDGEGTENPVLSNIELTAGTTYNLSITMENTLVSPVEDITEEVREEGDEHQVFFSWTDGVFANPTGSGNINATGSVNYTDQDSNGNPIGLSTDWTAANQSSTGGQFTILLKHQPDVKSATTTSADGETDIDITWVINVND